MNKEEIRKSLEDKMMVRLPDYDWQLISDKLDQSRAEERERIVGEVIKVIVSEYKSATNSYKIAKMNVEEGKKWAEADCISENSKQVVLSRLEPKISSLLSSLQE